MATGKQPGRRMIPNPSSLQGAFSSGTAAAEGERGTESKEFWAWDKEESGLAAVKRRHLDFGWLSK